MFPLKHSRLPLLLITVLLALTGSRCGQPIPPTGGPKDSLPPVLVAAQPGDSTLNFKGNKIVLQFNEYITLENPFEKLNFSPLPKITPQAEGKLKTVTIKIKDTLEPNTTYSIDFGDAIQDINEKNILQDFRYVFSTGSKIDSGLISGSIFLAETGKIDTTILVVLHTSTDDSAFAKERPRYVTRVNKNGDFVFRYLAEGNYAIFGLKDMDGGKKYDQATELIAFHDTRVNTNQANPVVLYAFSAENEQPRPAAKPAPTAPASGVKKNQDDKRLRYTTNLEGNKLDVLGDLVLSFENKLTAWDSARLVFADEAFTPIRDYQLKLDSTGSKIILKHAWTEQKKYQLIIQREFARDSAGNFVSPTDTLAIQAKGEADYGSLSVRVRNLNLEEKPLLQFYREDKLQLSIPLTDDRHTVRLMRPGDYDIRVLYDRNGNGRWDTGNYWTRKQPERVVARKQRLNVRANWDNEMELDMAQLNPEE